MRADGRIAEARRVAGVVRTSPTAHRASADARSKKGGPRPAFFTPWGSIVRRVYSMTSTRSPGSTSRTDNVILAVDVNGSTVRITA